MVVVPDTITQKAIDNLKTIREQANKDYNMLFSTHPICMFVNTGHNIISVDNTVSTDYNNAI